MVPCRELVQEEDTYPPGQDRLGEKNCRKYLLKTSQNLDHSKTIEPYQSIGTYNTSLRKEHFIVQEKRNS